MMQGWTKYLVTTNPKQNDNIVLYVRHVLPQRSQRYRFLNFKMRFEHL